jgi:uncharacterized protein with HEPN domain
LSSRVAADHLNDILRSIGLIESFVKGLDFRQYAVDDKTQAAVERHLQIITEAAYRLGDEAEALCPGPDWRGYCGMGNVLRHAYHRIQPEVIWQTITEDLPIFQQAVQATLSKSK